MCKKNRAPATAAYFVLIAITLIVATQVRGPAIRARSSPAVTAPPPLLTPLSTGHLQRRSARGAHPHLHADLLLAVVRGSPWPLLIPLVPRSPSAALAPRRGVATGRYSLTYIPYGQRMLKKAVTSCCGMM